MKTAREALKWVKEASKTPSAFMTIPLMISFLIKHFDEGKGIDEQLEME